MYHVFFLAIASGLARLFNALIGRGPLAIIAWPILAVLAIVIAAASAIGGMRPATVVCGYDAENAFVGAEGITFGGTLVKYSVHRDGTTVAWAIGVSALLLGNVSLGVLELVRMHQRGAL